MGRGIIFSSKEGGAKQPLGSENLLETIDFTQGVDPPTPARDRYRATMTPVN